MNDKKELMNINGNSITAIDVMDAVDTVLEVLWQTGNNDETVKASNSLGRIEDVSGKAKAKLWFGWNRWWNETGQGEKRNDTFLDMMEAEVTDKIITVKRYINVWKYIDNETIPKDVQSRRMDDLVKIATPLSHGHEYSKEDWNALKKAANSTEVRKIISESTGKPPRNIKVRREISRDGSMNIIRKDGTKVFAGYLELKSSDSDVQKWIRSIIDNTHVHEK